MRACSWRHTRSLLRIIKSLSLESCPFFCCNKKISSIYPPPTHQPTDKPALHYAMLFFSSNRLKTALLEGTKLEDIFKSTKLNQKDMVVKNERHFLPPLRGNKVTEGAPALETLICSYINGSCKYTDK